MDRGMQMGEGGDPSGAAPLREPKTAREWEMVWDGRFRIRPQWDLKVGESAWPFKDGEYVRVREVLPAHEARSAPEPAPGEGSPSELDTLRDELEEEKTARMSAERALDDWLEVHKEFAAAWKASGPDPFAHPSGPSQDSQEVREAAQHLIFIQDRLDEMTGLKREELNHVTIADLLSEKDKAIKAVRAALLSQSPKGAAGADVRNLVKAAAAAMEDIEIGDLMQWPKGLALVDALAPFNGEGGDGPSAPKTGLRGAGAPGDGDPEHYGADALAWMRAQVAALVGDHAKTWGPLYLSRALSLYIQKPAPGDVGAAGGVA